MQNSPDKKYFKILEIQKNKFLTKGYTILIVLFYYHLLPEMYLFYIIQNTSKKALELQQ
jgi:hypothetical protein